MPPFDDGASAYIGDLTAESGADHIALHGGLDITRDRAGLPHARAMRDLLDAAIRAMEADAGLPDRLALRKPATVRNPFA